MKLGSVLLLPATGLKVTAAALRLLASTGQRLADLLSPGSETPAAAASSVDADTARPAPRAPVPPAPVIDPLRLDVVGLAARPAPEILAALDSLGTAELADLYEHESKHRRRRTVLAAITAATAPPAPATAGDDDELLDDVRIPDELVYTTQTPGR